MSFVKKNALHFTDYTGEYELDTRSSQKLVGPVGRQERALREERRQEQKKQEEEDDKRFYASRKQVEKEVTFFSEPLEF
mgnify:CR=1 FL=1